MMKARASRGVTGENAIIRISQKVDVITGLVSIIMANSMMGELIPKMSAAIASSKAVKVVLPISQESLEVIGITREPLPHLVDSLAKRIKEMMR